MAYNETLADKIRQSLASRDDVEEKKMFGGIAFMVEGKMCVGVIHDDLMVRVDPKHDTAYASEEHARPMDFTNRPMKGYLYINAAGWGNQQNFNKWLERALDFNKFAKSSKKKK